VANNVGIATGADATAATDDVGGVHYQVVKLADGTEDSSTRIPGSARGLKVEADVPTNGVMDYASSTNLDASATVNLDTGERASKKLKAVEVFSSVPFKAALHTIDNTVESTNPKGIGGSLSEGYWRWVAPHRDYVATGTTAGTDAFRVKVTSLDSTTDDASAYAVFYMED
jgi:hypothetical protein